MGFLGANRRILLSLQGPRHYAAGRTTLGVLGALRRTQLGDERAQLEEGAAGHFQETIELLGDALRFTIQKQAGSLGSETDAKDRLADRIVHLTGKSVALTGGCKVFGLGGLFL